MEIGRVGKKLLVKLATITALLVLASASALAQGQCLSTEHQSIGADGHTQCTTGNVPTHNHAGADINSGTLPAAQMPAHTGDCTSSAGSMAMACTQLNGSNFAVNTSGVPTKAAGVVTAGLGVAVVQCLTTAKVETAADTNVLTCTPAAAAGAYEVCVAIDVSAATTATLGWTMTWTNSKGNANAPTNMPLQQMGVAAPALTFAAAANNSYHACVPIAVNNAATNIVVKTTFTGTSIAYNVTASIKRIG